MDSTIETEALVIGAGISGLTAAKCMRDAGFNVTVLERSEEVGGLWTFRENDYGVMRCTHINVSKYNYCFSDFPFPDNVPDYPHNTDMAQYIRDYMIHFKLDKLIKFNTKVFKIERQGNNWHVTTKHVTRSGENDLFGDETTVYVAKYVAIATGHHAEPSYAKFLGQDSFKGQIIHSVKYKDVRTNKMEEKRVLVVGIGNSAVDIATELASTGRCKPVYISTRSGAWVIPNYIFGYATDLYACRMFFMLPRMLAEFVFETVIKLLYGNPRRWKLNPKMSALQTQPTVSPTLIHHIQRGQIKIVPNIQRIEGSRVYFIDGQSAEFENIIMCTGYKIDLPFLSEDLRQKVLDSDNNSIKLYKNVFCPAIDPTLAFIGFVQPASGGVLTMSEIQARWFAEVCKGRVQLPSITQMEASIRDEKMQNAERYYHSARHTIQKDPILYNDEIAAMFGVKPEIWKHPTLAWRLLLSSCGAYQWRLQGPNSWAGAPDAVRKVPITDLMHYGGIAVLVLLGILILFILSVIV
ncbi:hypothetical protein ACJMK2_017551 [Sinanodonta woodiana]|uniref:Flavin-containing monooxygenase n=1 Tax=Sinanodonta woodiana TaxID=1069815 RepID=A0ABD3UB14_SINWO